MSSTLLAHHWITSPIDGTEKKMQEYFSGVLWDPTAFASRLDQPPSHSI